MPDRSTTACVKPIAAPTCHVAPTRSMLADALGQYLVWKQWKRWLLVAGSHDQDKLYADALRPRPPRARRQDRPGRTFEDTGGRPPHRQRRHPDPASDAGVQQAAPAYDVLGRRDESEVFASYLPIAPGMRDRSRAPRAWCRPVGTRHRTMGAVQMQNRS